LSGCNRVAVALLASCLALALGVGCFAQEVEREDAVVVGYVDDTAEGCKSLGASGHAIRFERPEDVSFVEAVHVFCARYGQAEPPQRDFHIYLLDEADLVICDLPFAYGEVEPGGTDDLKWHSFKTPAVEVPESFKVALSFEPGRTSGVYVGYDESVGETHSYTGLPEDGLKLLDRVYDWMVRVTLVPTPSEGVEVKRLADRELPAETEKPEGSVELNWDDGESDGMQSYGGAGPRIAFKLSELLPEEVRAQDLAVFGLRIYGSRYGGGFDPETTTIEVNFLDAVQEVYATQEIPYAKFSHKAKWVDVVFEEPVLLASQGDDLLDIALDPEAHQTKGIYFHYNENPAESHSSYGRAGKGFKDADDREWMIRAWVGPKE
jgi:hypothetical protein